jgi:phenylacetate-CoA ligase
MPTNDLPFEQQYPGLSESGRRMLQWLNEHPDAPRYTHVTGHRLTSDGLRQVRDFDALLRSEPVGWLPGHLPAWLPAFVETCLRDVPFYRRYHAAPAPFEQIPTFTRADLASQIWSFVPDSVPLDDLIVYGTSGTTGHHIDIPYSPAVSSMYLPLLNATLGLYGLRLEGGPDKVSCLLVCDQKTTFTLVSVNPYLADAGFAKINLSPGEWPSPESPARFINACQPEIFTGDPLAFTSLMSLPLTVHPKALISTAMAFPPGRREQLEAHFACPVIDLYSMTESGPIAALEPDRPGLDRPGQVDRPGQFDRPRGYALIYPRLYIEILDEAGQPLPPGEFGEITLTGGFNNCFPLLRYRTNDFARLVYDGSRPVLIDLHGRAPILFRTPAGKWLNNVDVNNALYYFFLERFALHQRADGSLRLRIQGTYDAPSVRKAMLDLFGSDTNLTIEPFPPDHDTGAKMHKFTSDLS